MRQPKTTKLLATVLLLLVLLSATAGTVYAFLTAISAPTNNTLTPAPEKDPVVTQPNGNNSVLMENLCIKADNLGYPVYMRAVILVTWEDANGAIYGDPPVEGRDYTLSLRVGDADPWFLGIDGFYYHRSMVQPNSYTNILVEKMEQLATAQIPDGYSLHIQLVAQSIQAVGTTDADDTPAVQNAWKVVTVDTASKELTPLQAS